MTESNEIFPAEDVEASVLDHALQAEHSVSDLGEEICRELEAARGRALAAGAPETTRWIYFTSPEWTWRALCGREGWLLYDPETKAQFEFFMTVMN